MTKYKSILILLISLSIIKLGECYGGRAMTALSRAARIHLDFEIHIKTDPVKPATITKELHKHFELGISGDEDLTGGIQEILLDEFTRQCGVQREASIFLNAYYKTLNKIDAAYLTYDKFLQAGPNVNITEMKTYFEKISDTTESGLNKTLISIYHSTIVLMNLFENMADNNTKIPRKLCGNNPILRQQHILKLFNFILNKTYKGYYLLITAHKFLTRLNKENHIYRMESALEQYNEELTSYSEGAAKALRIVSRDIHACDDDTDIKHETYVEISGPSQGFIFDSSEVNPRSNCASFNNEKDKCEKTSGTCFEHTCAASGGILKNCERISQHSMKICPSTDTSKKYLSAESDHEKYGNQSATQHCPKDYQTRTVTQVQLTNGIATGEYIWEPNFFCYCSCERTKWQPGDVRAISLQWAVADYKSNKVITGLRFEEKNGMISLNVQQGEIITGGRIDQNTVSWLELSHPEPSQSFSAIPTYSYPKNSKINGGKALILNQDFMYVTKELEINLDYINVPENHVVVGVKLEKSESVNDKNQVVLELNVWSMHYDIEEGKLNTNLSEQTSGTLSMLNAYLFKESSQSKRQELVINYPGNPTSENVNNIQHSADHVKVKFVQTDLRKDLGQSIVPFIDIRPVTSHPAIPITGVSLDHRGDSGSAGFIGFKLRGLDVSDYFQNIISNNLNVPHRSPNQFEFRNTPYFFH